MCSLARRAFCGDSSIITDFLVSASFLLEKNHWIIGMLCSMGTPLLLLEVSFSVRPLRMRVSPKRITAVASTEVLEVCEKAENPSLSLRDSMKLRSACTFTRTSRRL